MIEFRDLYKSFGAHHVLRGVSLAVEEGETLALLGPSGTGKSVLIKHAIGLLEPDSGDVVVDGISIANASARELRSVRRRIGYVFQNAALFDSLTVAENLWLALTDERDTKRVAQCRGECEELLARVNMTADVLGKYPSELSGGMRKRVGVARAIAHRPRYLLWDEPTTGLDPVNADNIDELIMDMRRQLGVTSIVVTHDLDTAFEVGDRIALLFDGRVRTCQKPDEIMRNEDPIVRRFVRRSRMEAPAHQ
jgi:phospholipid/cholesterol/gamma-HCH transport system ATP-binding protein